MWCWIIKRTRLKRKSKPYVEGVGGSSDNTRVKFCRNSEEAPFLFCGNGEAELFINDFFSNLPSDNFKIIQAIK